jgi:hypothetical protein
MDHIRNRSDEFDESGERSRAILAFLILEWSYKNTLKDPVTQFFMVLYHKFNAQTNYISDLSIL